jgi:hypothetical protein
MKSASLAALAMLMAGTGLLGASAVRAEEDLSSQLASQTGFCAVDGETPQALRAEPEAFAKTFLDAALGFKPEDAYEQLYPGLKQVLSKGEFLKNLKPLRDEAPISEPRLTHFYRIILRGEGAGKGGKAVCFEDESKTARHVFLSQASTPEQVQLVYSANSTDYRWAVVLWMVNERSGWSVLGVSTAPEMVLGHSSEEFLRRGREEEAKGHGFNATLLYTEALSLLNRGQSMQLERQSDMLRELGGFRTAPELGGSPPYRWNWGGADVFTIRAVTADPWHGRLALYIVQSPPGWDGADPTKAEGLNHKLIDAFVKAHPEWGDALDAIVAILVTADGRPYETVFDKTAGYVSPK